MKRFTALFLVLMICLVGCGKSTPKEEEKTSKVSFTINGVTIIPGDDFTAVKDKLGEPVNVTEAASCYFDGMDKVFAYDGFEVRTYPNGDKDMVQDLNISSDKFKTDKDITIGSSLAEVTSAYGEDYKATGNMYRYYLDGDKYIYFFCLNDAVKFFGFAVDPAN